jgi:serine/threonine protein kinase/outer membrane protein assembly factor BamB
MNVQQYIDQELGNYRLIRVLGEGGFASVYLGEHIHLRTLAAIKIHHARFEAAERERFEQEARTIAQLRHPHIVRVFDYGVQDGVAFLVMDYASQGTLRELHPAGSIVALETVVQYVRQVASALQYAHEHRLVHRDVKPENMLLDARHNVLLSDFGIAVAAHSTRSLGTQDAIGTVTYMAPEQLRKKARPASDQYALATIAYEWLCGAPPFEGLPIEVALQQITDPIPPLSEKRPDLPPAVEQVLLRALAKEPEKRFPTIQTFADAFEKAAQAEGAVQIVPLEKSAEKEAAEVTREHYSERLSLAPVWQVWSARRRRDRVPRSWSLLNTAFILLLVVGLGMMGTLGALIITGNHVDKHPVTSTSPVATFPETPPLPTGATSGDWVEPGFDAQNSEYNSYEHTLNVQNVGKLSLLWQAHTSADAYVVYNLAFAVAHGVIYYSDEHSLLAVSAQSGKILKTYPLPPGIAPGSTPAIVGDQLYLNANNLASIDLRTGASTRFGSFQAEVSGLDYTAPVVANGIIYGVAQLQEIYAVSTQTNQLLWEVPLSDVTTTPAVANGVVYVGGYRHLYALDARTSVLLWQSREESSGNTGEGSQYISGFFAPVVGPRYVYATEDNQVLAYPRQCTTLCNPAWSFSSRYVFRSSPSFANGILYAATGDWDGSNTLYALDGESGKLLWSAAENGPTITPPIIANGVLYLTDWYAELLAYAAKGCGASLCKPIWSSFLLDNGLDGRAVSRVVDGRFYVLTTSGKLLAFSLSL